VIEYSDDSISDLRTIRETIADDSPARAIQKIEMLLEVCRLLDEHPAIGKVYVAPYRQFSKERWIIIYRPTDRGVFIHRIFHTSQDWQARLNL